jgi:hypothetical protein
MNNMKKIVSVLLAAVLVFTLFTSCGLSSSYATPLLWRVTSPSGNSIYIFGSIHIADEFIYPLPDYVMDAFNAGDYLAVEADIVAFETDLAAQAAISPKMMYNDGRTITDDLGAELVERAKAVIAESDTEYAAMAGMLDGFKPYTWSEVLTLIACEKSGLSTDYGLDRFFILEAMEKGMKVLEIESIESQVDIMLGFSVPLQAVLIESLVKGLDNSDKSVREVSELYRAWKSGDSDALIELGKWDYTEIPEERIEEYKALEAEYMNALLTQRDIHMAQVASQYMADGKSVFYVVGLAHLVGENSVIDLLIEKGYTVELVS